MSTLKGTEASLSYAKCFLYLVSSSINASIFHSTWLFGHFLDRPYMYCLHIGLAKKSI